MFSHQAVIMTFRYVLEGIREPDLLEIDRQVQIPNASMTRYRRHGHDFALETFADTGAVERTDAAVTEEESR